MDHWVNILMFDISTHILTSLECKDHVKYLGVLLDSHLSWKYHMDNPIYPMAWLLGVELLNPIYKESSCYKNVSFG